MELDGPKRAEATEIVATTLMRRSSRLLRLLASFGSRELTSTEASLLAGILDGPLRITELAENEALAQPTVSKLVDRLAAAGLVVREKSAEDGRVVLVAISELGRDKVQATRTQIQGLMRQTAEDLSDDELAVLVEASAAMQRMIDTLSARKSNR